MPGTQSGVYRSDDRGDHWEALESPRDGMDVWSLAVHPSNPDVIYAGYEPCSIYRTENGGESWSRTNTDRVAYPNVTTYMPPLAKRVIGIAADPSDPSDMYASIEVGGLLASRDGGESWDSITDGLYTENHTVDLHGVQVSPAAPGTVFIIAQIAMFRSRDRGHRWEHIRFGEMFPGGSYCRGLIVAPDDPSTLYLAAGAGGGGAPAGTQEAGALFRSRDTGETWDRVDIGDTPPSRMFQIAIDRATPSNVLLLHRLRTLLRQRRRRRNLGRLQPARRTVSQPPRLSNGRRMSQHLVYPVIAASNTVEKIVGNDMNISIREQHVEHIQSKVDSGMYPSSDAVIAKALALLDEHDDMLYAELSEVRKMVQEGVEALKNGDYVEYTDENLHEFFEDIKRRGRERWASGKSDVD